MTDHTTGSRRNESKRFSLENALNLKRAFGLVWQSAPGWTAASAILVILQSILSLSALYLMKLVVDAVTDGISSSNKDLAFGNIAFFILISGVVALLSASCRSLAALVNEAQSQSVTDHMQDIIHTKSIEIDLEYYENSQYYDTFHRAQQEASYRPTRIVNGLVQVVQSGISLLAIVGLLVSLHWLIALILLFAAVPGVYARLRYAGKMYIWQRQSTPRERKAWYLHWLLISDGFAKEIRLFNLGSLIKDRFSNMRSLLRQEKLEIGKSRTFADLVAQASSVIAIFGTYGFIAYRTVQGSITLGDLVMYYAAFQQGQSFLQGMLTSLAGLYEDNLFLTSLYEFLDLKPKVVESSHAMQFPLPIRDGIDFDQVSFQYSGSNKNILTDITFKIGSGESVAFVGENGSGKTSLIKLLCRLYDPTKGKITIDGIDLREFQLTSLRREIGVIFQDYSHYNLTARENIWFGDVALPVDNDNILQAARCSGAHEVIARLKHDYETVLGRWFEDGAELSIGEWQKVALARAFIRDAQVIVLDEPTSSLDPSAEDEVFKHFHKLAQGKISILISHRLSTVTTVDRIYFFKNGMIVETGTHRELMAKRGEYAHLFELQAKNYRS